MVLQLQQDEKPKSVVKQICILVEKINGIEVLFGISILIFFAYSIAVLATIEKTLKENEDLNSDAFKTKLRITRVEMDQLHSLFMIIVISLTSVISIWVWNYVIPSKLKLSLMTSKYFGLLIILFFFIVSIISFFTISRKSFSNEPVRIFNVATIFFTTLILFMYATAFVYNKYI